MSKLTWLHISDLHMNSTRPEYDRSHVRTVLHEALVGLAKSNPRPDLIFFTGDLAFGDLAGEPIHRQFDDGFELLSSIRAIWSPEIPIDHVFLVPGNHDVQRELATPAVTAFLRSIQPKQLQQLMQRRDRQWQQIMERLVAYRDALRRHKYEHLLGDTHLLSFVQSRTIRGQTVEICGLNTAWSSGEDGERGRLWCGGRFQLGRVAKSPRPALSIGLMHHPASWFRDEEDVPGLERILSQTFTFLLHGHEHDQWVVPTDSHVRFAAGAMYAGEDAQNNAFNLTTFDRANGQLLAQFMRYDTTGRRWIPGVIGGQTNNLGVWTHTMHATLGRATVGVNGTGERVGDAADREKKSRPKKHRKGTEIFLAVPMAAISTPEYVKQRRAMRDVVACLRSSWSGLRVYYPAEHIKPKSEWEPPDMSLVRGLRALESCRLFVLIYHYRSPSSIIFEAGIAYDRRIPSIYFVKKGIKLPYLMDAAGRIEPRVRVFEYSRYADIAKLIRKFRNELSDFMATDVEAGH